MNWTSLKLYSRWFVLGGTLFFLAKALQEHWHEVARLQIDSTGWATVTIALGVTLLAHTWSGWVWIWILSELNQRVPRSQFIQVYLKTNIAKYLPGNVWHYYGRISAAKNAGVATSAAILSVLLEPLLMVAAALIIVCVSVQVMAVHLQSTQQTLSLLGLGTVLIAIHPWFLNPVIRLLNQVKGKATGKVDTNSFRLVRYPLRPLLGELFFLGLRYAGFLLTLMALSPVEVSQISLTLMAFSFAWLLGLVAPVPGGLGIFEVTVVAILNQHFSVGVVLGATALYRLVSILAETVGAGLAWLDERCAN